MGGPPIKWIKMSSPASLEKAARSLPSSATNVYLFFYNVSQSIGWAATLITLLWALASKRDAVAMYHEAGAYARKSSSSAVLDASRYRI